MWAQLHDLNSPQKQGRTAAAPPLSKGVCASFHGGLGEGETPGETQETGGPLGASQNTSHDIFRGSSPFSPAHAILQTTGVTNHDKGYTTKKTSTASEAETQQPRGYEAATTSGTNGE